MMIAGTMGRMTDKRIPLDATGRRVAENVKRLRGSTQYKELSERLEAVGRPIPPLGLRRIESGDRRVDVDDLFALAIVFGVSPLTLLLPSDGSSVLASRLTGDSEEVAHNAQWLWALGEDPLHPKEANTPDGAVIDHETVRFRLRAKPNIEYPDVVLRDLGLELVQDPSGYRIRYRRTNQISDEVFPTRADALAVVNADRQKLAREIDDGVAPALVSDPLRD